MDDRNNPHTLAVWHKGSLFVNCNIPDMLNTSSFLGTIKRILISWKVEFPLTGTALQTIITKTRLYNFDPLKPHFYIVKLAFTGVNIIFVISAQTL